jgi:hypothetical protein
MTDIARIFVALLALLLAALLLALLGSTVVLAMASIASAPLVVPDIAVRILGARLTLTKASKMFPVYSFSLPARLSCPAAMASIKRLGERAVCFVCYAYQRGNYLYENVQRAQALRFAVIREALRSEAQTMLAVAGFAKAIERAASIAKASGALRLFRWHDSGDLFSAAYARFVRLVCEATPTVRHWVPTREHMTASKAKRGELRKLSRAPNVALRCSALEIDKPLAWQARRKLPAASASIVASDSEQARRLVKLTGGVICPATASEAHGASCLSVRCFRCYFPDSEQGPTIYLLH